MAIAATDANQAPTDIMKSGTPITKPPNPKPEDSSSKSLKIRLKYKVFRRFAGAWRDGRSCSRRIHHAPPSWPSGPSGRDGATVVMGPIRERFGEVNSPDPFLLIEVGQGSGDLQHPVEAAGGQAHRLGRVPDEGEPVAVGVGHFLQEGSRAGSVGRDRVEPQRRVASGVALLRRRDPEPDPGR